MSFRLREIYNSKKPDIIEQEALQLIMDYMEKQIELIDQTRKELREKYPDLFKE